MENRKLKIWAGIILLLVPVIIISAWTGLIIHFDYPEILRDSTERILQKYKEGGTLLKLLWSGMLLSSLLIIPVTAIVHSLSSSVNQSLRYTAFGFGLTTSIFHILGFSRWLFAVDYLANQYAESSMNEEHKTAIAYIFNTMHWYFGVTIGETFGFITMGIWAILFALVLYQSGYLKLWLLILSIISGAGVMAGTLEWAGWKLAAEVNAYAYQTWIFILAYIGVIFLVRSRDRTKTKI